MTQETLTRARYVGGPFDSREDLLDPAWNRVEFPSAAYPEGNPRHIYVYDRDKDGARLFRYIGVRP